VTTPPKIHIRNGEDSDVAICFARDVAFAPRSAATCKHCIRRHDDAERLVTIILGEQPTREEHLDELGVVDWFGGE
jgi:hypothetical protein